MEFIGIDLYLLMTLSIIIVESNLNPEGENVCLKYLTYTENVTWPNTEMKKPINRTKITTACCVGYKEAPDGSKCLPACPKGCGNGKCVAPGECSCNSGFSGTECDEICDKNKWGGNCINKCQCSENEICDRFSGCICKPGWIGDNCTTPCPKGYYGNHCMGKCLCDDYLCDHLSGECITSRGPFNALTTEVVQVKEETTTILPDNIEITSKVTGSNNEILEKLITNITDKGETSGSENQLFNPISDSHTTENETLSGSRVGNFIPTFTVLSSVSLLILFIGGKWLFVIFRDYFYKMTSAGLRRFEEELIILPDTRISSENFEEATIYTSDIKAKSMPTLHTFKPPTPQTTKIFKEKTPNLIPA